MVEIFGTPTCGFCKHAIALCEDKAVQYTYTDVSDKTKLLALEERVGAKVRHVPQIFVNNEYIAGGYTGLKEKLA